MHDSLYISGVFFSFPVPVENIKCQSAIQNTCHYMSYSTFLRHIEMLNIVLIGVWECVYLGGETTFARKIDQLPEFWNGLNWVRIEINRTDCVTSVTRC